MHYLVAVLYGTTFWLSLIVYLVITGRPWGFAFALAPVLISGAAAGILTFDFLIYLAIIWVRQLWPKRRSSSALQSTQTEKPQARRGDGITASQLAQNSGP